MRFYLGCKLHGSKLQTTDQEECSILCHSATTYDLKSGTDTYSSSSDKPKWHDGLVKMIRLRLDCSDLMDPLPKLIYSSHNLIATAR